MKKLLSVFLSLLLALTALAACKPGTPPPESGSLNVLNFGEYISDGSEGTDDVIADFEKETGLKVNYDTVDTNEKLYAKLKGGGVSYDVIVASDYMLARLMDEGMLQKLDYGKITNWGNIDEKYKKPYFDPEQEYTVPYFVGYTGICYNTKYVKGTPDSWEALWDTGLKDGKGNGKSLLFDNPRDAFAVAQGLLGYDFNSADKAQWEAAAGKLKEQKAVRYGFVVDDIFNIMENNEAWITSCYAGDAVIMMERNEKLDFVTPKEKVNFFIDSFALMKDAASPLAAHKFIDFMTGGEAALANAEYVVYASPNTKVVENPEYEYYEDEILYPAEEDMPGTEVFKDLPQDIIDFYNTLWNDIKK